MDVSDWIDNISLEASNCHSQSRFACAGHFPTFGYDSELGGQT